MSNSSSNSLFELIKSLSQSEKRYFKRFVLIHSFKGENNYVKLFDAISNQKVYDEGIIIRKGNFNKNNQFPSLKNYLYNLILKSLESYHSSIDSELRSYLHQVEILFEKALFAQCRKILDKAMKLAEQFEKDAQLIDILQWKSRIAFDNTLDKVIEATKRIINKNQYFDLLKKLESLIMISGNVRDAKELAKFKKIITHPLLKNEKEAFSFEAKSSFYLFWCFYYQVIGDNIKSYIFYKKRIELTETNALIVDGVGIWLYIASLNNLIAVCLSQKRYVEIPLFIDKARNVDKIFSIKITDRLQLKIFENYFLEVDYMIETGKFAESEKLIHKIEQRWKILENKLSNGQKIIYSFSIAYLYFGTKEYDMSIKWLNKIINNVATAREDIQSYARILNLAVHYELHNFDHIEYLMQSTQRFLNKRNKLYEIEGVILKYMKLLLQTNQQELKVVFKKFKTEVSGLIKENPESKTFLENFDIISWLESKIENKPFGEIMRGKALRK